MIISSPGITDHKTRHDPNGGGRYHKLFTNGDFNTHYYSDVENAVCLGHYLLSRIDEKESLQKHIFLLEDGEFGLVAITIKERVLSQKEGSISDVISDMEYDCQSADHVWCSQSIQSSLPAKMKVRLVDEGWFEAIPDQYLLKKNSKRNQLALGGVGFIVIALSIFGYLNFTRVEPESYERVVIDPWASWRKGVVTQFPASLALKEAITLYSYGALLPESWTMEPLMLVGGNLGFSATRNNDGLLSEWEAYLASYPEIAQFSELAEGVGQVTMPLSTNDNSEDIVEISGMPEQFHDVFVRLGAGNSITQVNQSMGEYFESRISFSFSGVSFAILDVLRELFDSQPVYLTQLIVKPASTEDRLLADIEMSITVQGVHNE